MLVGARALKGGGKDACEQYAVQTCTKYSKSKIFKQSVALVFTINTIYHGIYSYGIYN